MLKKSLYSLSLVALFAWCTAGTATAQELRSDKAIYFTFSQSVTLPNTTLAPGKYLFRLADSQTNRGIVQIYSGDGAKPYGMMMTRPIVRTKASDNPEIRFLETAAGTPAAVSSYWFPGMTTGWEFIYPREQALRLAHDTGKSVLTTAKASTSADDMKTGDLVRVNPAGEQVAATDAPEPAPAAVTGTSVQGEMAMNAPAPAPPQMAASSTRTRTRLPQTASATPIVTLTGLLALCAGLGLATMRKRTA